jgi:hypothetical protein
MVMSGIRLEATSLYCFRYREVYKFGSIRIEIVSSDSSQSILSAISIDAVVWALKSSFAT